MQNSLPGSFMSFGNIPNACSVYKKAPLSSLFSICNNAMQYNNRVFMYRDQLIRMNPHWIRDYMLTVKGFRFTEKDLTSFPDLLLETQHESGFFYEIVAPFAGGDIHGGGCMSGDPPCYIVDEPYRRHEPDNDFGLVRLELEADIEYLMVEGCYIIWQSTGDDQWLKTQLPRLEKGLEYMTSSPIRWNNEYQLAIRAHTLDTWDFTDRESCGSDRMIRPEDPMGIFHGDNTGLFYAKQLLAKIYDYFGDTASAARHREEAAALRERIMKHLWNGSFFCHFLMIDPADYGVDERYQLSLSNSYALNRELLTLEERRKLIDVYKKMREKYQGVLDDFRNLDPPFPKFFKFKAGDYVNGATAPFVAGQLALGAFESGEEEYGADILDRIGCKFLRDGKVSFLYNLKEEDIGGGPRCWCGAEVMNAMTSGLAGVVDNCKLFKDVTISPRFAAANEKRAYVRLEYAASGASVEYEWRSFDEQSKVEMHLKSCHDSCKVRMYAPRGKQPFKALCNGVEIGFEKEKVAGSSYAVVSDVKAGDTLQFDFQ